MTTQSSTGTVSTVLTSHFEHLQTLQESRVCSELLGTEDTLQTRVFQVQSEGIPDFENPWYFKFEREGIPLKNSLNSHLGVI